MGSLGAIKLWSSRWGIVFTLFSPNSARRANWSAARNRPPPMQQARARGRNVYHSHTRDCAGQINCRAQLAGAAKQSLLHLARRRCEGAFCRHDLRPRSTQIQWSPPSAPKESPWLVCITRGGAAGSVWLRSVGVPPSLRLALPAEFESQEGSRPGTKRLLTERGVSFMCARIARPPPLSFPPLTTARQMVGRVSCAQNTQRHALNNGHLAASHARAKWAALLNAPLGPAPEPAAGSGQQKG